MSRAWAAMVGRAGRASRSTRRHRDDDRPADQHPRHRHVHRDDGGPRAGRAVRRVDRRRQGLAPGGAGLPGQLRLRPGGRVGLLLLFHAHPMVAAGLLILATCPGAPYGPPFTAIAGGNLAVSAALMVILAGSSTIVAPLLLHTLLPLVSGGEPLRIDAARMVGTLLVAQLVPLCVGLAVRQWCPIVAARLQDPANLAGKVLNPVTVGLILVAQFRMLTAIRPIGFAGMLALLTASLASGWLAGGLAPGGRKAVAMATSLRNVGVGLV